jgi:hypothetical protein
MTSTGKHSEARFEEAIEIALAARGYDKRPPATYDAAAGLFPADVLPT